MKNIRKSQPLTVRSFIHYISFILFVFAIPTFAGFEDEEMQEAIAATKDEWNALRQSMQQGSAKLKEFKNKYQEYEDKIFSQDMEKGIAFACKLLQCQSSDKEAAKKALWQVREMFNTLDKNGLKTMLQSASDKLELADKVAGEVTNAFEFAEKFNPSNAKDNPTYGLRLIGTFLKDGAGKFEKIPLVGQILGKWVAAYGEVAGDFANALDRLSTKIRDFRQGSLCGQLGTWTSQQTAFKTAATGPFAAENCMVYFEVKVFKRMHGQAYEGGSNYFLYDPATERGYFGPKGMTEKVYEWHNLLWERQALKPDWLARRARTLTSDLTSQAYKHCGMIRTWASKTDKGWVIIDAIGSTTDVEYYGRFELEEVIANYLLAEAHRKKIDGIVAKFEKYLFASGQVFGRKESEEKPLSGATVSLTVGGKSVSKTTDANGNYDCLIESTVGASVDAKVSHKDFDDYTSSGRWPEKIVLGWNFTLTRDESSTFTISGTVYDTTGGSPKPMSGATVSATTSGKNASSASATSGGDGAYTLTLTAPKQIMVTVSATKGSAKGGNNFVADGSSRSGLDIVMSGGSSEPSTDSTAKQWTVMVTVLDNSGTPLPQATVSSNSGHSATTGGNGVAKIGPLAIKDDKQSITLSATIKTADNSTASGNAQTISYEGDDNSAITLTIPVIMPRAVTVGGKVTDIHGVGIQGAVVTGGGKSATSTGGGTFSFGTLYLIKDSSITLSASYSDGSTTFGGSSVTIAFDGTNTTYNKTLVLDMETESEVTITGRVIDSESKPLAAAAVTTASGASTSTDGGGIYTLSGVRCVLGKPVSITATITVEGGQPMSGQNTATPKGPTARAGNIVIAVTQVPDTSSQITDTTQISDTSQISDTTSQPSDTTQIADTISSPADTSQQIVVDTTNIDSAIIDIQNDTSSTREPSELATLFDNTINLLDGLFSQFMTNHNYFVQKIREKKEKVSQTDVHIDVSYSFNQCGKILSEYQLYLGALPALYGEILVARAIGLGSFSNVEGQFSKAQKNLGVMQTLYGEMQAMMRANGADPDEAANNANNVADDEADPNAVQTGVTGNKPGCTDDCPWIKKK